MLQLYGTLESQLLHKKFIIWSTVNETEVTDFQRKKSVGTGLKKISLNGHLIFLATSCQWGNERRDVSSIDILSKVVCKVTLHRCQNVCVEKKFSI